MLKIQVTVHRQGERDEYEYGYITLSKTGTGLIHIDADAEDPKETGVKPDELVAAVRILSAQVKSESFGT